MLPKLAIWKHPHADTVRYLFDTCKLKTWRPEVPAMAMHGILVFLSDSVSVIMMDTMELSDCHWESETHESEKQASMSPLLDGKYFKIKKERKRNNIKRLCKLWPEQRQDAICFILILCFDQSISTFESKYIYNTNITFYC